MGHGPSGTVGVPEDQQFGPTGAVRTRRPGITDGDESVAAIVERLVTNVGALGGAYVDLARHEARCVMRGVIRALVCLVLAAIIGTYAVGLALAAVVLGLARVMPGWAAALVTFAGMVAAVAALVLVARSGLRLGRLRAVGAQAKGDVRWLRNEIRKNV